MQKISTIIYLCNNLDGVDDEQESFSINDLSLSHDPVLKTALNSLRRKAPEHIVTDLLSYAKEVF